MERREVGGGEENGASQSKSQAPPGATHSKSPAGYGRIAIEYGDEITGWENRFKIVGWKEEEDGEGGRERRSRHKETKGQRKKVTYEAICASR